MDKLKITCFFNKPPLDKRFNSILNYLGDNLNSFYGFGIARNQTIPQNLKGKVHVSAFIPRFVNYIIDPIFRLFHIPVYKMFLFKIKLLEYLYSEKVVKDDSQILFTSPLFLKTIKKAKAAGKTVVLEAGNSEPQREYERIRRDYEEYGIKHIYIYGDPIFKDTCNKSFLLADYIITISKTSRKTYIDAGYPADKLVLIPLTGTDFPCQDIDANENKQKVFITTAFHNFIKGTHRLLLAWKEAKVSNIPLIVVGRICEDLQEFIEKYGPFENVVFTGYVEGSLKNFFKQYDAVGILMSLSEGAVRTTPELMSFGFPMIVSLDATCDIVEDGKNGYVIDYKDTKNLINRIKWFANDWNRVHTMRSVVLSSVSHRTVEDYSRECAKFILNLNNR